jgi:hypothetical protein
MLATSRRARGLGVGTRRGGCGGTGRCGNGVPARRSFSGFRRATVE